MSRCICGPTDDPNFITVNPLCEVHGSKEFATLRAKLKIAEEALETAKFHVDECVIRMVGISEIVKWSNEIKSALEKLKG